MDPEFTFKSKVWLWSVSKASWHFVTVPMDLSKQIKSFETRHRGFSSIPVEVTIGKTTWKTSIFHQKKGTYVLPLKKEVRKKEGIVANDTLKVKITLNII